MSQVTGTMGDFGSGSMYAKGLRIRVELNEVATTTAGRVITTAPKYFPVAADQTFTTVVISPDQMLEPGRYYIYTPVWAEPGLFGDTGMGRSDSNSWKVRPPEGVSRFVDVIYRDNTEDESGLAWFGINPPEPPGRPWVDISKVPMDIYEWRD